MVIKYRRKVINDDISERLKQIFSYIGQNYGITVDEWNHDIDHVHVMFRGIPSSNISKFINAYKSASSRLIKNEFPSIKEKLWKNAFWSQSFCLITTGGVTTDVIKRYIETQGCKNEKKYGSKNKNIS
jgi:putative transposase